MTIRFRSLFNKLKCFYKIQISITAVNTGIIKLSELTKHPQHMVRYSLRILEQEGLIEPSPHGAVTTDVIKKAIPQLKIKLKDMNKTIDTLIKSLD